MKQFILGVAALLATCGVDAMEDAVQHDVLSTQGSTRGTAYCMSNKIVTLGAGAERKTHAIWLEYQPGEKGKQSVIEVRTFDHANKRWTETVHIGDGHDNHAGGALAADSRGILHCIFGPHHGPFQYRHTIKPNDASQWAPVTTFGKTCTYPSMVVDAQDTLHVACRDEKAPFKLNYYRKPKGQDWQGPVMLVDPTVPGGYTQFGNALTIDRKNRIHMAYHIYDLHPAAGKFAGYMRSDDAGLTWRQADGTLLELPVTRDTGEAILKGDDIDIRCGNIVTDAQGNPWFCTVDIKNRALDLHHHDGVQWRHTGLLPFVQVAFPGCGIATDGVVGVTTSGEVWVFTSAVKPGDKGWGSPTSDTVLLRSRDGGKTFDATPVSPPQPAGADWLCSIEGNTGHSPVDFPALMYMHGSPGTTCSDPIYTEIRFVQPETIRGQ